MFFLSFHFVFEAACCGANHTFSAALVAPRTCIFYKHIYVGICLRFTADLATCKEWSWYSSAALRGEPPYFDYSSESKPTLLENDLIPGKRGDLSVYSYPNPRLTLFVAAEVD